MGRFDELFDDTKLNEYRPVPPWLFGEAKANVVHRKGPMSARRREYEGVEIVMEGTKSGAFSVKLYDTSSGYQKLVGRTSSLSRWEAEDLYEELCEKFRGGYVL